MGERELRKELDAVYSSISWRLTAPLRWVNHKARLLNPRHGLKPLVYFLLDQVRSRPAVLAWARRLANRFPRLKTRLRNLMLNRAPVRTAELDHEAGQQASNVQTLSIEAQQIYHELIVAMKEKK